MGEREEEIKRTGGGEKEVEGDTEADERGEKGRGEGGRERGGEMRGR